MKKKRKTTLPRVTLMAFDKRSLVAFCEAVETLRLLVEDLRAVARDLGTAAVASSRKRATRSSPDTKTPATLAALVDGAMAKAGAT